MPPLICGLGKQRKSKVDNNSPDLFTINQISTLGGNALLISNTVKLFGQCKLFAYIVVLTILKHYQISTLRKYILQLHS